MEETNGLVLTDKQIIGDKVVVTVLGSLAGLLAHQLVDKGYKAAITAYRLKRMGVGTSV
jgi:hypothetical protein